MGWDKWMIQSMAKKLGGWWIQFKDEGAGACPIACACWTSSDAVEVEIIEKIFLYEQRPVISAV
jgi:hypothetical protein